MALYALLVGIAAYRPPISRLAGGVADVAAARKYLTSRMPRPELHLKTLTDAEATRAAVIDGLRSHLGQAGPADTALFWFSGHGSQAPVPPELARMEPTGLMQTILCVDSRHDGVPDLLDKEVGILLAALAADGAHVAVVLDCCHADGADRDAPAQDLLDLGIPALQARWTPAADGAPDPARLLPELRDLLAAGGVPPGTTGGTTTGPPEADHVTLAACHSTQLAFEIPSAEGYRGLFSLALIDQLGRLGPHATYRELLAGARCRVEAISPRQRPVLFPGTGEIADQQFLGGPLRLPQSSMLMRFVHGSWEIDAGACHGIDPGTPGDRTRIGVYGANPARESEVVSVLSDRSIVEPVDWEPDFEKQYPIVVTSVPLPAVAVTVGGRPEDDPATTDLIMTAVRRAAPGGRPSPHLTVIDRGDPSRVPEIRIACPTPGTARILHPDGKPQAPDALCGSAEDAAGLVRDLEHIAQWRRIRALDNPMSALANAVSIEVVAAQPGETVDRRDRPPMQVGENGALTLDYRLEDGRWVEPGVFIRLRNNTKRDLYCVLLDLTDRFRMHPALFPGDWVGAGYQASAANGNLISLTLPPGRERVPGASVTDWLKVFVAEDPFSSAPFHLPRLGEPPVRTAAPATGPLGGVPARLGLAATHRTDDETAPPARDWAASILALVTRIPDGAAV